MRKLATIRKIDDIVPIEGADAIECAIVGGWKVVVKKNEYVPGDLVVYCEIDSWIPTEIASFLSNGKEPREYNGVKGERLRTIKLRGQISQGLILPISVVKERLEFGTYDHGVYVDWGVGFDCSEMLGIQKWEAPISAQLAGEVRGVFPSIVPKTDQERIQNLSDELNQWNDLDFEVTEKLDGSSCTMFLDMEGDFHVCSRNLDLKPSDTNSFWRVALKYDVDRKLSDAEYYGVAIQGELIGPGIQGNPYNLKDVDFFVFDVYSVARGEYLSPGERIRFCKIIGLNHVPVLTDSVVGYKMEVGELLNLAEGKSVLNPKTEREGIVFKCLSDPSIHFKAISNKFLIKGGN